MCYTLLFQTLIKHHRQAILLRKFMLLIFKTILILLVLHEGMVELFHAEDGMVLVVVVLDVDSIIQEEIFRI